MHIRTINRRSTLINAIAEGRASGHERFWTSAEECVRMCCVCLDKDNADAADSWLERGADHVWGKFSRPFGWL